MSSRTREAQRPQVSIPQLSVKENHQDIGSMPEPSAESVLLKYYADTADQYDRWHFNESEHNAALGIISGIANTLRVRSVLDVACGTGRGWLYLKRRYPELRVRATDISEALLSKAIMSGVSKDAIEIASGYSLPYRDGAFDLAIELGALHHVARPALIINEMLRVSRIGIALSDSNMYVTGLTRLTLLRNSFLGSVLKLILVDSGVLRNMKHWLRGREYSMNAGDGVFYTTYSIFQSVRELEKVCERVLVIPIKGARWSSSVPLLAASHCVVIALKTDVLGDF